MCAGVGTAAAWLPAEADAVAPPALADVGDTVGVGDVELPAEEHAAQASATTTARKDNLRIGPTVDAPRECA
jgi:hypothetical protein